MKVEALAAPAAGEADPARVRQAAGQFEALLVAELLKSARGEKGWLGAEDQAGASMLELAEEHLAGVIAANGGLGLADLIVGSLTRSTPGSHTPRRKPAAVAEARTGASPPEGS